MLCATGNGCSLRRGGAEVTAIAIPLAPEIQVYYSRMIGRMRLLIGLVFIGAVLACGSKDEVPVTTPYAILFVTQVPPADDDATRLSAVANHLPDADRAPRGGDLMLRYPDGTLRNLTREAGYGVDGLQGSLAIAVREPAVHWSGTKALFSMVVGAPTHPGDKLLSYWQLYEITGLGQGDWPTIARVKNQPERYNNLSPLYGTNDRVLFTSDRPPNGLPHLYPLLDEYDALPTTSGLWSLEPTSGSLTLLSHSASGAFTPILDSYGRIIFTRWDHLQQDRLAERDRNAEGNGVVSPFGSFNYADERLDSVKLASRIELFPESGAGSVNTYGRVSAFASNFFAIWQINEDGTGEETLNHVGQHELAFGFLTPSFMDDPSLSNHTVDSLHANPLPIRREGGLFHVREDPRNPGVFFATSAREADSFTTDRLVKLSGAPTLNGEQMVVSEVTAGDSGDVLRDGRFRNPLPLSDGQLVASHTRSQRPPDAGTRLSDLRLKMLVLDPATGRHQAGPALTKGIGKTVRWWSAGVQQQFSGDLWELDAVEVRPRGRPFHSEIALEAPERAVLAEENVSETTLRAWLVQQGLALIVTRDQTSRDQADLQQPFNLQVPGGVKTLSRNFSGGTVYDIAHFQIFQGNLVRAYSNRVGRRILAQPIEAQRANNPINPGGPPGSVRIAMDGSTAAFVPAGRALTWQSTDPGGVAIVRERNWITLQPGEIRTCASCHGVNSVNQAGATTPVHKPQALRDLIKYWKTLPS